MQQQRYEEENDENENENANIEDAVAPTTFHRIEELESHGINKQDIVKLKAGGYHTIESVAHSTMKKLMDVKGISEQKAQKLKDLIKSAGLVSLGFQTATSRLDIMKDMIYISTGSKDLDNLLGGGVETGSLTEVFGEFRTGKTQLCHTLCVNAQRPLDQGGAEGKAIYVDTEGTFRPQKLVAIAERYNMNPEEVLDNVICARAHNSEQQMELLADAAGQLPATPSPSHAPSYRSCSLDEREPIRPAHSRQRHSALPLRLRRQVKIPTQWPRFRRLTNLLSQGRAVRPADQPGAVPAAADATRGGVRNRSGPHQPGAPMLCAHPLLS